jgi:hypothetical protein
VAGAPVRLAGGNLSQLCIAGSTFWSTVFDSLVTPPEQCYAGEPYRTNTQLDAAIGRALTTIRWVKQLADPFAQDGATSWSGSLSSATCSVGDLSRLTCAKEHCELLCARQLNQPLVGAVARVRRPPGKCTAGQLSGPQLTFLPSSSCEIPVIGRVSTDFGAAVGRWRSSLGAKESVVNSL